MAKNPTYAISEVVGSSSKSISAAIDNGIVTAAKSLRNLSWFEVTELRGHIEENKVSQYQVTLKLGFRYED